MSGLSNLMDGFELIAVLFVIIVIIVSYSRIITSADNNKPKKSTMVMEIDDPYLVNKLQNMYERQDLYAYNISVINGEIEYLENHKKKFTEETKYQTDLMDIELKIASDDNSRNIIRSMYEEKFSSIKARTTAIDNKIIKLSDKRITLSDKSTQISESIDKIAITKGTRVE